MQLNSAVVQLSMTVQQNAAGSEHWRQPPKR